MCNIYTTPSQKEHLVAKAAYDRLCADWNIEDAFRDLPSKRIAKIRGMAIWMLARIIYDRFPYYSFLRTIKDLNSKAQGFGNNLFYIISRKGYLQYACEEIEIPRNVFDFLDAAREGILHDWLDWRRFASVECEFEY